MPKPRYLTAALALGLGLTLAAPRAAHALEAEYAPIVLKANDDTFLRFILWNQIWTRLIENNPGTTIQGEEDDFTFDVGNRRLRMLAFGKIGDDVLLMFHFGINNQTFRNNVFQQNNDNPGVNPNFFIHDAWTEFKIVKSDMFRLDFGGGLIYWNGISRMTNASTLNLLAVDAPITNWPLINGSDQFARHLGLYVKGHIAGGLVDYRVAAVRPFTGPRFQRNPTNNTWGLSSYVKLQLMDKESNTLPYAVGTYLGKKRVLNFGVGQHWHPEGTLGDPDDMGNRDPADTFLLGADIFADIPFGDKAEGGALTAYGVFYYYDFGSTEGPVAPGRALPIGIMPLANAGDVNVPDTATEFSINGGGNRYHSIGSGVSVYGQVGYLLPGDINGLQIQPYVTAQVSSWDQFADVAPVFEAGSNFYLYGHHAKFTINYRARPIMTGELGETANPDAFGRFDSFASELILQTMIFL